MTSSASDTNDDVPLRSIGSRRQGCCPCLTLDLQQDFNWLSRQMARQFLDHWRRGTRFNVKSHLMLLRTERLLIRPIQPADLSAYAQIVANPAVTKYLYDGVTHSPNEAALYIADCINRYRSTGISRYAVTLRSTGVFIGFCGMKELPDYIDFGYRYDPNYWGVGIATEAGQAVVNHARDTLQLSQLISWVQHGNVASAKVLRKLGFLHMTKHDENADWYKLTLHRYY